MPFKQMKKSDIVGVKSSDCHSPQLLSQMDNSTQASNYNNNNNISQSNGVVCEGWLTKSPPEKIWKTKWRRRWFVLRLSGQIPGQYVLEYYYDSTKRKLKGVIDLDQCEQVDAGLQLESRKENFQFMFDVRTSKRTFYLVAKSELEMNKWVECICSVCGLKIHVEEGQDDRYSPQPSQEFVVSANNNNNSGNNTLTSTISSALKTGSSTTITSVPTSSSTISSNSSTNTLTTNTLNRNKNSDKTETINNSMNSSKNTFKNDTKSFARNDSKTSSNGRAVTHIEGPSGPYIPISECHTGRPINGSASDIDSVPTLPSKLIQAVSDECYDIPRPVNPQNDSSNDTKTLLTDNLLDCVPKAPKLVSNTNKNSRFLRNSIDTVVGPPLPNWDTYPGDSPDSQALNPNDVTRTSVRSNNAVDVSARHQSITDSGFDTQRSSSPLSSDFNRDSVQSTDGGAQPPPRPPKPPSFRRYKNKSESCASLPNVAQLYDVPITAVEHNLNPENNSPTLSTISRPPAYSLSDCSPKSPDELYDFPRMNTVSETQSLESNELINATVPIAFDRSTRKSDSKKHSYTNAPPGYFTNKETVFNYEYRPTLTSGADDTNAFITNNDLALADRSPLTPNSATYNNLPISSSLPNSQSFGPPAVNRDLKPRRKGSDSDTSNTALPSPTTKTATPIQLQPPPALTRIHSAPTKRSFRKPGTSGQSHMTLNGNPPRIPSRPGQYQHNREASTSEDDVSHNGNGSRRNSSNDEPQQSKGSVVPPPRPRPHDGSEIQYLDLDLDSDSNSQSPRTPNEHNHQRSGSTLSNKEVSTNVSQPTTLSSASTVYKTVDFLKTEAFNKMRLNVENYRNSQ